MNALPPTATRPLLEMLGARWRVGVTAAAVAWDVSTGLAGFALTAGYANGAVVVCQPNSAALLFLRTAGEGAVTALAFSPTGGCLAIGTDGGEIGVLALPDTLFRDQARQP